MPWCQECAFSCCFFLVWVCHAGFQAFLRAPFTLVVFLSSLTYIESYTSALPGAGSDPGFKRKFREYEILCPFFFFILLSLLIFQDIPHRWSMIQVYAFFFLRGFKFFYEYLRTYTKVVRTL